MAFTGWPSSTAPPSPSTTAPIDSSSRFRARPTDAALELEQLVHADAGQARHGAMPSPTSMTRPTWADDVSGVKPSRFFWRAAVMSAGVDGQLCHLVGSFCVVVGSRTRSGAAGGGTSTEPSMTVSPTWATSPPSTVGSTMTLSSTFLPVAASRAVARRGFWSSVSSTAERTSATSLLPSAALSSTSVVDDRRQVAGATGADHHRHERGGDRVGLAAEEVLDDLLAAAHRQLLVGERGAQLVVGLEHAGEAEQLVAHLAPARPRHGRPRAEPPRRRGCARRPSVPSRPSRCSPR